jgi:quercetin dioxygenase-like cupin family protein
MPRAMRSWNLLEIDTPEGSRSPVVLHSGEARAVLIGLAPGQALREHEVKEQAFVTVVEGRVRVEAGGESTEAEVGTMFVFDPEERHSVATDEGARILMVLAPWPGEGHYRGGRRELDDG